VQWPTATPIAADGPTAVKDCQPCIMALGEGSPTWLFFFDHNEVDAVSDVISQIRARPPRSATDQLLPVEGMLPSDSGQGFRFGGEDLDGDGWRDLVLVTADGGANVYAAYWRFDPSAGQFEPLGTLPLLGRDPETGHLVGLEHGSADGTFFTRTDYGFEDGELTVLAVEAVLPADEPGQARHVVQQREQGVLVTIVDELVPLTG
jgi:hypothetical protein